MEDSAYQLILGDSGKPFNLSIEDANMRNRYGRNTFGQSCLLARRLVESGVPYITINFNGGILINKILKRCEDNYRFR